MLYGWLQWNGYAPWFPQTITQEEESTSKHNPETCSGTEP